MKFKTDQLDSQKLGERILTMQSTVGRTYVDHPVFSDLRTLLDNCRQRFASHDAYVYRLQPKGRCAHKTYQAFWDDINALGTGFLARGLVTLPDDYARRSAATPDVLPPHYGEPGSCCELDSARSRIAVIGENSYAWILQHNANLFGLGISVPLDKQLSEPELKVLLNRAAVDIICFDAKHYPILAAVLPDVPTLKHLVLLDDGTLARKLEAENPQIISLDTLLTGGRAALAAGDDRFSRICLDPDAPAALIFTSGTSAQSKGVLLSHRNIAYNAGQAARLLDIPTGTRALSLLPLHHTFENTCGLYGLWNYGVTVHINDNLRYVGYNLQDWKIQFVLCVPAIVDALYKQIQRTIKKQNKERQVELARLASNSMRMVGLDNRRQIFKAILDRLGDLRWMIVGAAALDPVEAAFFNDIGIELWTGYGLTESAPLVSCNNQELSILNSVGVVCPDLSLKIVSDEQPAHYENTADNSGLNMFNIFRFFTSNETEPVKGEICVKGKNVMLGYFGDPDATAAAIDAEGWLHTGDVGYLNEKGCLFITGRIKSMIVLNNGKKVFPEEIEAKLCQIAGVKNALCWGEPGNREQVDVVCKLQLNPEELPENCRRPADTAAVTEVGADSVLDTVAVREYLDEHIAALNQQLAEYKYIRYCIYTLKDFNLTTTLKIRRAKEIEATHAALAKTGATLKDKHLQSID